MTERVIYVIITLAYVISIITISIIFGEIAALIIPAFFIVCAYITLGINAYRARMEYISSGMRAALLYGVGMGPFYYNDYIIAGSKIKEMLFASSVGPLVLMLDIYDMAKNKMIGIDLLWPLH